MLKQTILLAVIVTLVYSAPSRKHSRLQAAEARTAPGPLADYVAKVDDSYKWTKRQSGKFGDGEYAELTLTSQTWKNIVWKHQLFVYKPAKVSDSEAGAIVDRGRPLERRSGAAGHRRRAKRSRPDCWRRSAIVWKVRSPCSCTCPSSRSSTAWSRTI